MSDSLDPAIDRFLMQRMRFFSEAGQCIIQYQSVEDYLEDVFVAALGVTKEKAIGIFSVARGLEPKINVITSALIDADEQIRTRWVNLHKRIVRAAEARNQIAHARPVSTSDPIQVVMDTSLMKVVEVKGGGNSRTEIWKKTRNGEIKWTEQSLREEYIRSHDLFGALVAFVLQIQGSDIPEHLRDL